MKDNTLTPTLPGAITPVRPVGTPAGQPTPSEPDPAGSYAQFQRALAEQWCQDRDHCGGPCLSLCGDCREYANRQINGAYARRNRMALEIEERRPGGNAMGRIEVAAPATLEEYERLRAEQAERRRRDRRDPAAGADAGLAALAGVLK